MAIVAAARTGTDPWHQEGAAALAMDRASGIDGESSEARGVRGAGQSVEWNWRKMKRDFIVANIAPSSNARRP